MKIATKKAINIANILSKILKIYLSKQAEKRKSILNKALFSAGKTFYCISKPTIMVNCDLVFTKGNILMTLSSLKKYLFEYLNKKKCMD